jgi:hypothetical protein
MSGAKGFVSIVLMVFLAAFSSWAQDASFVGVPISGTYYEPALADTVQYSGEVRLVQAPGPNGTPEWRVSRLLVDAWTIDGNQRFTYVGLDQTALGGAPGQVASASLAFLATASGSGRSFSGALAVPLSIPRETGPAEVSSVTASSGRASVYREVPVYGRYFEPALNDWVDYAGSVHVSWVAASPSAGWLQVGVLVADAQAEGSGARFTYHGISRDYSAALPGTLDALAQSFWATGGRTSFGGALVIAANETGGTQVSSSVQ